MRSSNAPREETQKCNEEYAVDADSNPIAFRDPKSYPNSAGHYQ